MKCKFCNNDAKVWKNNIPYCYECAFEFGIRNKEDYSPMDLPQINVSHHYKE